MTNFFSESKNLILGPFNIPYLKFQNQLQENCWKGSEMDPNSKDPSNQDQAGLQITTGGW